MTTAKPADWTVTELDLGGPQVVHVQTRHGEFDHLSATRFFQMQVPWAAEPITFARVTPDGQVGWDMAWDSQIHEHWDEIKAAMDRFYRSIKADPAVPPMEVDHQ